MKKEIPETPEFIHTMIQNEVKNQLRGAKVAEIRPRRVKKWMGASVAAVAAICVLATSTIAYMGIKLYHMYSEKQGIYGILTGIKVDDGAGEMRLPKEVHGIDITAGYIPEGMEWMDEWHLAYPEHNWRGGFSFSSVLLDRDDLSEGMQDKNVVDCEERTFGNYEGVYLRYNDLMEDGSFNQRIYLLCPDVHRVVTVYIGDDVGKEDAIHVAENLAIKENDTVMETANLYTWSDMVSPERTSSGELRTFLGEGQLPVYRIGDAFQLAASSEGSGGDHLETLVSVSVDSVQVADDLQLLDSGQVPEEWLSSVGEDGKLVDNTLSYVKSGDGIDSLDEIVKTEEVKQKLVYVTVTYTNESEEEIRQMLYLGTLVLMNHENGGYQIYNPKERSGDGYDHVIWDGAAKSAEMTYSTVAEDYGDGGNYISSIKPGEGIQVNMAWIVNENDLDHMYLNLSGQGGAYGFTDSMLESGLVDICQ